ncbi:1-deoxy-D-xylulose-5-phosphate reductoisomerase [Pseudomonas sp. SLFW]|uniref:1-deoxy-D-xylulose-5-phosphate reductoisomerase n=1 Tax=Pseudomonas sp. SLFW TaxID=2683259 RepID=UPI0014129911|nr:1-deoxy-D-xylulose-5-phosphate reductoisomerase [Pseudomonas sp. SLFW]NBB09878.1 1-deoxy-D-xylulose-5-phosphate reductoisomerase [Pseudomonas sp. SLFW]
MGRLSAHALQSRPQRVCVLGATGSVGASTLDVIGLHPGKYEVFALSGYSRLAALEKLCVRHRPQYVVIPRAEDQESFQRRLVEAGLDTMVLAGADSLDFVASHQDVDTVVAAIVGSAGLSSTLSAVRAGKKILLANKEALVMSGALFMQLVRESGATIMPIDSEHNAIFQCLPFRPHDGLSAVGVRRIILTASGGPLRNTPAQLLREVTVEQACAHPTWSMGRKISVDSATLMNKGLELIEACWLFNAAPSKVEVVIHPQSVVHSLVDYVDGSMLAHLGNPDMRVPISHALAWPQRIESGVATLDLLKVARLDFESPDEERFPCLRLAREAATAGGSAPAILNAANEVAVQAFLSGHVAFTQIADIVDCTLQHVAEVPVRTLEQVIEADAVARREATRWLKALS